MLACVLSRPFPAPILFPLALGVCSAAGIALVTLPRERLRRAGLLLLSAGIGLLLGLGSLLRMTEESRAAFLPFPENEVSGFTGVLLSDSVLSSKGDTLLSLALTGVSSRIRGITAGARGRALVRLGGDYRFPMGQVLAFTAGLSRRDSPTGEAFAGSVERKDVFPRGYSSKIWRIRASARGWVHQALSRAGYPASALMEALLIGSREDVPEDLSQGFRRTGSLHILALSGLHVSVIYAILLALLGFLRAKTLKLLVATAVLLFYQVLAGFMPSLLRATIMIIVGGIAMLLDRDAEPLNLLALSGIVVLLVSPFEAFSLSFQLSYLALAGILAVGPALQRALSGLLPKLVLAPLAMSVGAQVATFPLIAARFGFYYPSGLLAGLLLVPLTTAVLWGALAWLPVFALPWPFVHDLGARGFSVLYGVISKSAEVMGSPPGVFLGPQVLPWAVGGSILLMVFLAFLVPVPRRSALPAAS